MKFIIIFTLLCSILSAVVCADATADKTGQARLRAIAVGNKVDLKYSQTYETWQNQWLNRQDLIEARGEVNSLDCCW